MVADGGTIVPRRTASCWSILLTFKKIVNDDCPQDSEIEADGEHLAADTLMDGWQKRRQGLASPRGILTEAELCWRLQLS